MINFTKKNIDHSPILDSVFSVAAKAGCISISISISIIDTLLKQKTGELSLLFCVSNLVYQSNPINF